jgi:hypothetical protein
MARYHVNNRMAGTQQNLGTSYKTLVVVAGGITNTRRGRAVAIAVGADGAPNATDCQIIYAVQRHTADGTLTSATPNPLVPGDAATRAYAQVNATAEGTYSLPIWVRAINQRATMQWLSQDTDAMLLWPATYQSGLALMALSPTYAAPALGCIDYEDL